MLANILDTARRFLSRSPSVQIRSNSAQENSTTESQGERRIQGQTEAQEDEMVTTRRGTATPGTESVVTPRSSGKKRGVKRDNNVDMVDSPTVVKRQRRIEPKRLEVEVEQTVVEDEKPSIESVEQDADTLAITTTSIAVPVREESLPIRRRGSAMVIVSRKTSTGSTPAESIGSKGESYDEGQEDVPQSPEVHNYEAELDTTIRNAQDNQGALAPTKSIAKDHAPASTKKPRGRKKKSQSSINDSPQANPSETALPEEIPSSTYESDHAPILQDALTLPSPPQKSHIRFNSEEPAALTPTVIMNRKGHERYEAPKSTLEQQEQPSEEAEDNASHSDEAPDVVTTASAASRLALATQEATRAQRAQAEKAATKRAAREQRIAVEQAAKRDREAKQAQKLARKLAKQERAINTAVADEDASLAASLTTLYQNNLPDLLPTSLLSNLSAQRPPTPPPSRRGKTDAERKKEKLAHHIKFLERADKPAKDVQRGKLSIAVLGRESRVLAPKVSKATREVREKWLKGREGSGAKGKGKGGKGIRLGKVERRAVGGGFLRGHD